MNRRTGKTTLLGVELTPLTRDEIRDEIWDAMSNRQDIDVSLTDLADAALERLESLGLIHTRTIDHPADTAEIVERLMTEAANLETDIEPGEPNEDVYRATVARLRADAALIEQQAATIAELRDILRKARIQIATGTRHSDNIPCDICAFIAEIDTALEGSGQ